MKTVGLITEYNPFHNGHRYHIEEAKRITGADYVVIIMSGNFVQRGAPAILNKYTRTEIALQNGADLVIELPVCYATASAEYFALGAVATLDQLGVIDSVCFGSESADIDLLTTIAEILLDEPLILSSLITEYMKSGMTFPKARADALLEYISKSKDAMKYNLEELKIFLESPNNILGIEYIKAIRKLKSNIKPVTIKRMDSNYHDQELNETFSSATSIRKSLMEGLPPNNIKQAIPQNSYDLMNQEYRKTFPILDLDISLLLKYKLMLESKDSLSVYLDVSDELKNRIYNSRNEYTNFLDFAMLLKTKQYTLTRVTRALIHILLNIDTSYEEIMKKGTVKYARILGFRKESSSLIRLLNEKGTLHSIIKLADAKYSLDEIGQKILNLDIFSSELYNSVVYQKYGFEINDEYRHRIIIV